MKVKEVMEKLSRFDPELECLWDDAIEGNDCPLEGVFLLEGLEDCYLKEHNLIVDLNVVIFSPKNEKDYKEEK